MTTAIRDLSEAKRALIQKGWRYDSTVLKSQPGAPYGARWVKDGQVFYLNRLTVNEVPK